jgi:hypothetical protein
LIFGVFGGHICAIVLPFHIEQDSKIQKLSDQLEASKPVHQLVLNDQ